MTQQTCTRRNKLTTENYVVISDNFDLHLVNVDCEVLESTFEGDINDYLLEEHEFDSSDVCFHLTLDDFIEGLRGLHLGEPLLESIKNILKYTPY